MFEGNGFLSFFGNTETTDIRGLVSIAPVLPHETEAINGEFAKVLDLLLQARLSGGDTSIEQAFPVPKKTQEPQDTARGPAKEAQSRQPNLAAFLSRLNDTSENNLSDKILTDSYIRAALGRPDFGLSLTTPFAENTASEAKGLFVSPSPQDAGDKTKAAGEQADSVKGLAKKGPENESEEVIVPTLQFVFVQPDCVSETAWALPTDAFQVPSSALSPEGFRAEDATEPAPTIDTHGDEATPRAFARVLLEAEGFETLPKPEGYFVRQIVIPTNQDNVPVVPPESGQLEVSGYILYAPEAADTSVAASSEVLPEYRVDTPSATIPNTETSEPKADFRPILAQPFTVPIEVFQGLLQQSDRPETWTGPLPTLPTNEAPVNPEAIAFPEAEVLEPLQAETPESEEILAKIAEFNENNATPSGSLVATNDEVTPDIPVEERPLEATSPRTQTAVEPTEVEKAKQVLGLLVMDVQEENGEILVSIPKPYSFDDWRGEITQGDSITTEPVSSETVAVALTETTELTEPTSDARPIEVKPEISTTTVAEAAEGESRNETPRQSLNQAGSTTSPETETNVPSRSINVNELERLAFLLKELNVQQIQVKASPVNANATETKAPSQETVQLSGLKTQVPVSEAKQPVVSTPLRTTPEPLGTMGKSTGEVEVQDQGLTEEKSSANVRAEEPVERPVEVSNSQKGELPNVKIPVDARPVDGSVNLAVDSEAEPEVAHLPRPQATANVSEVDGQKDTQTESVRVVSNETPSPRSLAQSGKVVTASEIADENIRTTPMTRASEQAIVQPAEEQREVAAALAERGDSKDAASVGLQQADLAKSSGSVPKPDASDALEPTRTIPERAEPQRPVTITRNFQAEPTLNSRTASVPPTPENITDGKSSDPVRFFNNRQQFQSNLSFQLGRGPFMGLVESSEPTLSRVSGAIRGMIPSAPMTPSQAEDAGASGTISAEKAETNEQTNFFENAPAKVQAGEPTEVRKAVPASVAGAPEVASEQAKEPVRISALKQEVQTGKTIEASTSPEVAKATSKTAAPLVSRVEALQASAERSAARNTMSASVAEARPSVSETASSGRQSFWSRINPFSSRNEQTVANRNVEIPQRNNDVAVPRAAERSERPVGPQRNEMASTNSRSARSDVPDRPTTPGTDSTRPVERPEAAGAKPAVEHAASTAPNEVREAPVDRSPVARVAPQQVVQHVAEQVSAGHRQGINEMVVRIEPKELGPVRIKILLEDGQIIARLQTGSGETKDILQRNLQQLTQALREQGVPLQEVRINGNASSTSGRNAGFERERAFTGEDRSHQQQDNSSPDQRQEGQRRERRLSWWMEQQEENSRLTA